MRPAFQPQLHVLEDRATPSAGDLDVSFGGDGLASAPLGTDGTTGVAVQTDHKVVVVSRVSSSKTGQDFGVARLNADGSPDNSFGTGGKVTIDFKGKGDQPSCVIIQSDGKIVVAGYANVGSAGTPNDTALALARLNANGSLDGTFGSKGRVTTALGNFRDTVSDIALQPDGKIVAVGNTTSFGGGDDFIAVRYTAAGVLDKTFDGDGLAVVNLGGADNVGAVAIQGNGKIVLAGGHETATTPTKLSLVRLTATGGLDPTFGTGGKTISTIPGGANNVVPDGAGNLLVGTGYSGQFGLVRFTTSGALDATFGAGGEVQLANPASESFYVSEVVRQPGGRLVLAGTRVIADGTGKAIDDFALARVDGSDGTLDGSFGTGGWVLTDFGTVTGGAPTTDRVGAMALTTDGKIVVAGASDVTGSYGAAAARYLGDDPAPAMLISIAPPWKPDDSWTLHGLAID